MMSVPGREAKCWKTCCMISFLGNRDTKPDRNGVTSWPARHAVFGSPGFLYPITTFFFGGSLGVAAFVASTWALTNLSASCSELNSLTDWNVCCLSVVKLFQSSESITSWAIMPAFPGRVATRQVIVPSGAGLGCVFSLYQICTIYQDARPKSPESAHGPVGRFLECGHQRPKSTPYFIRLIPSTRLEKEWDSGILRLFLGLP
jgi:hypothetical protein